MHRIGLLALAATCLSSCTARDTPAVAVSVLDSAGVTIVTNPAEGPLGTLTLEETLRLGVVDGGGPEQFSRIYAVALDDAGRILVANNGSATVRVFEPDGAFVSELGGRGDGPGEVTMVYDVFAFADTVALVDWQGPGKVVLYTIDGTLIGSRGLRGADGTAVVPRHRTADGWLASVTRPGSLPALSPGESFTMRTEVHLTAGGSDVGRSVYAIPLYTVHGTTGQGEGAMDWGLFMARTFSGFDSAGRLYVTDRAAYRVDVHDHEGLRRSIRRAYTPRRISDADVARLRDATLHVIDTMARLPDDVRARQRRMTLDRLERQAALPRPDLMLPLTGLLVSPDGSFWVRVADPETLVQRAADAAFEGLDGLPPSSTDWDLYDPSGALLGSVTLPSRFRAEAVSGFEVVGVWADELDVEHVVRYRATPAASARSRPEEGEE